MRTLTGLLVAGIIVATAAVAPAGERFYSSYRNVAAQGPALSREPVTLLQVPPAPGTIEPRAPGASNYPAPLQPLPPHAPPDGEFVGAPVELYHCVKYEDRKNIHPCAVTKIVAVKDPRPACECGPTGCVFVEICVPPDCCFKYKVKRKDGSKVEYDFGDYKVEIESEDGVVEVDYDRRFLSRFGL